MMQHVPFFRAVVMMALIVLLIAPAAPAAVASGPAGVPSDDQAAVRFRYFPLIVASPPAHDVFDEELVLLEEDGRIVVRDPWVPGGQQAVVWWSPSTGWTGLILGDFNGDGGKEILAFKGGRAELFDPVVPPGRPAVYGEWQIPSPAVWYNMAAGDIDGDGLDEIVLLRSDAAGGINSRLLVFDGNAQGTGWSKVQDIGHGARWDDVALGDVNGDLRDDIGLIRDEDNRLMILNPTDWSKLHEAAYTFAWLDLEMINTHRSVSGDVAEIVISRREVLGELPSLLVFRWTGGSRLADVWQGHFFPYFTDIEGADLNGDGDEEIVMYRDRGDVEITLASRNIAGSGMRSFEPSGGNSPRGGWLNLKAGDLDADGRDEVILVRPDKYRVYDRPEIDDHYYDVLGSWGASCAVGDLGQ
jgi:hypothetical protein